MRTSALLLTGMLLTGSAAAYVRAQAGGKLLKRTDAPNIQFLLNSDARAGLATNDQHAFITTGSDPEAALSSALAAWNAVDSSAARFAPIATTEGRGGPLNDASYDGRNVVVFQDSPEVRSALGTGVVAVTRIISDSNTGDILDTDIFFNPAFTFSTNHEVNTIDIQSVAAHEFGHALGANHTSVLSAVMFQSTDTGKNSVSDLSPDDVAFVSEVYPAPGDPRYGTISGRLTLDGAPARGISINAINAESGTIIGGLTSVVDGSYSFQAPPGNYQLFAQPLTGQVQPQNLNLASSAVDTNFPTGFLGGNDNPLLFAVSAAQTFLAPPMDVSSGASSIAILYDQIGASGGFADQASVTQGPHAVQAGKSVDLIVVGPGLDGTLTDANVRSIGAFTVRPGSVRPDGFVLLPGNVPFLRMTLDIPASSGSSTGSILILKDGNVASLLAGLIITPSAAP